MWRDEPIELNISGFFENAARILLSLLIVVIMLAILAGIGCTFYDLRLFLGGDSHAATKRVVVDMLTVLAVVEVLRTALYYFTEGRVKVTYIIDTVMVTVLTEVLAFWYREMDWREVATVMALVVSLACIRILAVRFSPRNVQEELT